MYAEVKKLAGGVPNLFAALGALSPQVLKAVLNAEGVLGAGWLSKQELETIRLLVSELTGCDYRVAAHTVIGKMTGLSAESLRQIRAGEPTGDARRAADYWGCGSVCVGIGGGVRQRDIHIGGLGRLQHAGHHAAQREWFPHYLDVRGEIPDQGYRVACGVPYAASGFAGAASASLVILPGTCSTAEARL